MQFISDFHIHSKFSRATSKNLDLENLYIQAQIKGISVLGTGDFTHPGWWAEIKDKLDPLNRGLFALKSSIAEACDQTLPAPCHGPVKFMLVTEISNIYKKDGRTRKNHNLVFFPDLDSAEKFRHRLDLIGNIRSDGRPILGLDAHDLLEIVLETSDEAYLVPAHIWTPWFSVLGSKSGFDSIEECFGDLTGHIFALETGLSSDPAMNWRFSGLDAFTLISNSDAHSPAKLGREANWFDTDIEFTAIRRSLETADPQRFLGTLEFFPEEGKYHLDGHRHCAFRSLPEETWALDGICPVCGKPVTIGVLNRVESLADRGPDHRPPKAAAYEKLIPLDAILAEIFQCGVKTKRVTIAYGQLVARYGSEFNILRQIPTDALDRSAVPLLGEAIHRVRSGQVRFEPGFDGEFGKISIFNHEERLDLRGQRRLFDLSATDSQARVLPGKVQDRAPQPEPIPPTVPADEARSGNCHSRPAQTDIGLNPEQQAVVDHPRGPLIVSAGPGTGKTHTIVCRMAALIQDQQVSPDQVLAVTFTNKAAREMQLRLSTRLNRKADTIWINTFHGLCLRLLRQFGADTNLIVADDRVRGALMKDVLDQMKTDGMAPPLTAEKALNLIIAAKLALIGPEGNLEALVDRELLESFKGIYKRYQALLRSQGMTDFEDLIFQCVQRLQDHPDDKHRVQSRFRYIFVDEFQDINFGQYRLIRLLAPREADICIIGDPDQAIYGFRGSDVIYFKRFVEDYPGAKAVRLTRNYRSSETIIASSYQVIRAGEQNPNPPPKPLSVTGAGFPKISIIRTPSAKSEAVRIGLLIEKMIGGASFHTNDFGKGDPGQERHGFSDFAVLSRTGKQGRYIADILMAAGIPCQVAHRSFWLEQESVAALLGVMRILYGQGTFADLDHLNAALISPLSKTTVARFKQWAYAKQLPLSQALDAAAKFPIPNLSTANQQRLVEAGRILGELKRAIASMVFTQAAAHVLNTTRLAGEPNATLLNQFIELAASTQNDGCGFGNGLALSKDIDFYHPGVEKVAVLTMHAAKGLEFPVVFIAGCEDGLIPHTPSEHSTTDGDEERRLFYVAMTRARERLFLTWSATRKTAGRLETRRLSPFVNSIEARWKEALADDGYQSAQKQLSLF